MLALVRVFEVSTLMTQRGREYQIWERGENWYLEYVTIHLGYVIIQVYQVGTQKRKRRGNDNDLERRNAILSR